MLSLLMVINNEVDMDNIRKWAKNEDRPEKFKEFERRRAKKLMQ